MRTLKPRGCICGCYPDDFDGFMAMNADAEVMRFIATQASDEGATQARPNAILIIGTNTGSVCCSSRYTTHLGRLFVL
jgi:hypothetical protein